MVSFIPLMLFFLLGRGKFYAQAHFTSQESKDFQLYRSDIGKENYLHKSGTQCSLFSDGKWVQDASYPLYNAGQCPYVRTQFNCRHNGRPDSDYERWRWQPDGCAIPRFNAKDMLEKLRGKRLMFVGDSLSETAFESLMCLLQAVIPSKKKTMVEASPSSPIVKFKALDYNASVEFFWAAFLVELEITKQGKKILHLDSIEKNGAHWKGVDILVFESSHWWPDHPGAQQRWDIIMEGNKTYTKMDPMVAYRKALNTWANWTYSNINFRSTLVFFRSMSFRHSRCENETEPVENPSTYHPPLPPQVSVVDQVLKTLKFPVVFMNITRMTELRKDGHPSLYGTKDGMDPGAEDNKTDCSHWCLPGVPDEWNHLLYAYFALAKA